MCSTIISILQFIPKFVLLVSMIAATAVQPDNLFLYTQCELDHFTIEESVERDRPFVRSVKTSEGERQIKVAHGFSLHIAYQQTPFVNFKAERLQDYATGKQALIGNLKYMTAGPDMESSEPSHSSISGLEVYGINHKQLAGGVLSIYLLFHDADQTVVTLYLLNTPPEMPKFHTIEEYRSLRDQFLKGYTSCAGASK
jgi:hypothetical protein